MLDQIKALVQGKIAQEIAQRFGLPQSTVNMVTNKILEAIGVGGSSGGSDLSSLISMGTNLLQNQDASSLIGGLKDKLPSKLTEINEIDSSKAGEITDFVVPKLQELISKGGDSDGGLMDKLGDFF